MTQKTVRRVRHRRRHGVGYFISLIVLTALCALILLPIVFTFLYSFFPKGEITSFLNQRGNYDVTVWMDVPLSPAVFSLRQYYKILIEEPSYLKLFCNSAMYTAAILVGQGLVIPLTAYALSRFEFRGKNALMVLIMMLMVLPFQVTMAPSVITLRTLGLMDTPWAVILPMIFSPFYIFLLRQFMVGLPNGLLEYGGTAAGVPGQQFRRAAAIGDVQPDIHRGRGRGLCGFCPVYFADHADLSVFPGGYSSGRAAQRIEIKEP